MTAAAEGTAKETDASAVEIVEITDERDPVAEEALRLIEELFPPRDRQPLQDIRMEIEEKRLELLALYDFHLLAGVTEDGRVVGVVAGVYLEGVNAGFISYLAVHPDYREHQVGRKLRTRLVEIFRADSRRADWDDLAWVLGEVRLESQWLRRLVRDRAVVPLAFEYYHPGVVPDESATRWVLYRQPIGDQREELPVDLVKRVLYSIWRRVYRVRYPLERPSFRTMLDQLEGRATVGWHPEVPRGESA